MIVIEVQALDSFVVIVFIYLKNKKILYMEMGWYFIIHYTVRCA